MHVCTYVCRRKALQSSGISLHRSLRNAGGGAPSGRLAVHCLLFCTEGFRFWGVGFGIYQGLGEIQSSRGVKGVSAESWSNMHPKR